MKKLFKSLCLALMVCVPMVAFGQSKTVTIVVPFTPGSGPDIVARIIAPKLSLRLNQSVIVENKAGASGNIGADFVAKSKPDGATLMLTVNSFNVTPALYKKLPYDPIKDFTPIGKLGASNLSLVINSGVAANNLETFLTLARSKPGALAYSSSGAGTTQHLAMEVFKKRYGLDILHVPYRGAAGAITDVIGGQTQAMMMPLHNALPFVRQGKLRLLAVVKETRSPFAPDIPSFGELGAGNLELDVAFWLSGPAGVPSDLVTKLNSELFQVLSQADVKDAFALQGITPEPSTPIQLADFIKNDVSRWRRFVTEQNIMLD